MPTPPDLLDSFNEFRFQSFQQDNFARVSATATVSGAAAGTTLSPTGSASAAHGVSASVAGVTAAPAGATVAAHGVASTAAAATLDATGSASATDGVAGTAAAVTSNATGDSQGFAPVSGAAAGVTTNATGSATDGIEAAPVAIARASDGGAWGPARLWTLPPVLPAPLPSIKGWAAAKTSAPTGSARGTYEKFSDEELQDLLELMLLVA